VEYRAQSSAGTSFTILLAFEDVNGGLQFLVHQNWRSLVQLEDVNYIDGLLIDFLDRAEEQPAALFAQVSSLGVGPLVTQQTGQRISDYPSLSEQFSQFVKL
jgi:hypothetical protein